MAARQFRLMLLGELLIYAVFGRWLVASCGWTPGQAFGLALAGMAGLRLWFVGFVFAYAWSQAGATAEEFRMGFSARMRMVFAEYLALIKLFTVIMPFEKFWMGPDRLSRSLDGRLPLLLIHGYQCNRGFWFWLRSKLEAQGWTVATHSMEPVYADIDSYADGIARRVDEVLAATGASQVILVAHSMGGLAARAYLRRHGISKVARLISLGSPHRGSRVARFGMGRNARQMQLDSSWLSALAAPGAAPLPPGSASIYSVHDNYVIPPQTGSLLEGADNIALGGVSHLAMAFSPQVLGKLREALDRA